MALDPDRVVKPVRKLRKAIKRFPNTPDPELVHDVRTRSRRIEAMLDALAAEASSCRAYVLEGPSARGSHT